MENEFEKRLKDKKNILQSKLDTLLDVTTSINDNSTKKSLFESFNNILIQDLEIGKFTLMCYDSSWKVVINEGIKAANLQKINTDNLLSNYKEISVLGSDKSPDLKAFEIVIPIYNKKRVAAFLLLADIENQKRGISPIIKHLKFIQTLGNIIVVALENKQLVKAQIQQLGMQKEMELAQRMQTMLFPKSLPQNKNLTVEAFYQPHHEIGGDYYDVIPLSEERTAICIADISGKGISAALLMANFQATIRALIPLEDDLEKVINRANAKIIASAQYEKFITFFIAIHDCKKKTLTYINAGHQAAVLFNENNYQLLTKGCTLLGMFDKLPKIETTTISIPSKATLYCFTDGISEIKPDNKEPLGLKGIINYIQKSNNNINGVINNITQLTNSQKSGGLEQEDDITFLAADFHAQACS